MTKMTNNENEKGRAVEIKDVSPRIEMLKYPNKEKVLQSIDSLISMIEKGFKPTPTTLVNLTTIREHIIKFYPDEQKADNTNDIDKAYDEQYEKLSNISSCECNDIEIIDMENVFGTQAAYCTCICLYNKCINRAASIDDDKLRSTYRTLAKWYLQKANKLMEKVDARQIQESGLRGE